METVEAKIYSYHLRKDGTHSVKIRVYHRDEKKFIDTDYFVSERQVKKVADSKNEWMVWYARANI